MVILAIVAHRFLRLDLTADAVAALHLPVLLTVLLAAALCVEVARRGVSLRPTLPIVVQWLLWLWAGVSKTVADGTQSLAAFVASDYTKDVVFATLLGTVVDSLRKLRWLCWVFVTGMTVIAALTIPQRAGSYKCYYYDLADTLNYVQQTDNRPCTSVAECGEVPKNEMRFIDKGWACEKDGPLGLATVLGRIHYVGTLADPNELAQALVMACALALGLLFWPLPSRGGGRLRFSLRLYLWGALLVMAVAVVFAASRAAQVALALTLFCFFYSRIGLLGALLAGVASVPIVLVSLRSQAEAAYSTVTRIQTQMNGYLAFLERPFFGVGFGNYEKISFINAHNSFLLSATETGVFGSALFILSVYLALKALVLVVRWPLPLDLPADDAEADERSAETLELLELRHAALTLLSMLVGVVWCVTFLSLSWDVMWLFPVGVLAAFYRIARDRLPEYELRLGLWELLAVLLLGAALPAFFVAVISFFF